LGSRFTIYDKKPPHMGAVPLTCRPNWRFYSNQVSPTVPPAGYIFTTEQVVIFQLEEMLLH